MNKNINKNNKSSIKMTKFINIVKNKKKNSYIFEEKILTSDEVNAILKLKSF